MKTLLRFATTLPFLLTLSAAHAQQSEYYNHPHMWEGGGHGWVFGPLMMILFVGIIVGAIIFVVRALGWHASNSAGKNAISILEERFARGEIDREEFEERRRALKE